MATGVWYKFEACDVQTIVGAPTPVPEGIYVVLESRSGNATIVVDASHLPVSPEEWMRLKLEHLARKYP